MLVNRGILRLTGPVRGLMALSVTVNLLVTAAGVAQIILISRLLSRAFAGSWNSQDVLLTGMGLAACLAVRLLGTLAAHRTAFQIASTLRVFLRDRLFGMVLRQGLEYQKNVSTGSLVSLAVDGVEALETYFGRYLPHLFFSMLAPVGLFAVAAPVHLPSALVLLAAVPLIPLSIAAISRWARRVAGAFWNRYEGLSARFLEGMLGLATLKVYNRDGDRAAELARQCWSFRNDTMRLLRMQLTSISAMDLIGLGSVALAVILAARDMAAGRLDLTGGVMVMLLGTEFFRPLRQLGSYYHAGINGMAAGDKMARLLAADEASGLRRGPAARLDVDCQPRLTFEGVSFSYEPGRPVLEDFSLAIEPGTTVALVGASGAGKSTVAHLLAGFLRPDQGTIRWNGTDLQEISRESLRANLAMVAQNVYVFAGSIADNLRLAKANATDDELLASCRQAGLEPYVSSLPAGLDTPVGERGARLSGGQRQKLGLARAFLRNAPVYVFDEATANVDAAGEEQIWQAIHALAAGRTSLIITHRLSSVREADRIVVLRDGRAAEQGTHVQLMAQGGLYRQMVDEQSRLEAYTGERWSR